MLNNDDQEIVNYIANNESKGSRIRSSGRMWPG